jgi:antitoxin (DNA-binding transcriptional repressor) of toxin-antitoxin stability system
VLLRALRLKILKNKLSEYVRLAAGGETVLITDRDRVVAEIVPPRPGRSPLLADAQLAEAVRQGWLAPPLFAGSDPPPRKPVMTLRELMQDLQHDREDR